MSADFRKVSSTYRSDYFLGRPGATTSGRPHLAQELVHGDAQHGGLAVEVTGIRQHVGCRRTGGLGCGTDAADMGVDFAGAGRHRLDVARDFLGRGPLLLDGGRDFAW